MPAIAERLKSIFRLDATKPLQQQYQDQRRQALTAWRDAVAAGADGRPVALAELQQAALAIGIVPHKLPDAYAADVAAFRAERELAAAAAKAAKEDAAQTIIAERAQAEVAQIEARWQELRRLASSAYGSGMIAGQTRSALDRHRADNPRLWGSADDAALDVPQQDAGPAITRQHSNDDAAEWITDDDK